MATKLDRIVQETELRAIVAEYIEKAEAHYDRHFLIPKVDLGLNNRHVSGIAQLNKNIIKLNPYFLAQNSHDMRAQTIPHEVAHIVAFQLDPIRYPARKHSKHSLRLGSHRGDYAKYRSHGSLWASVMKVLGVKPNRCHNYKLPEQTKPRKKWARITYVCGCQELGLTAVRHKRSQEKMKLLGRPAFRCRECKQGLFLKGSTRAKFIKDAVKKYAKKPASKKSWNPKPGSKGLRALQLYRDYCYLPDKTMVRLLANFMNITLENARQYVALCKKA